MLDLRAYSDVLFRADEVMSEKYGEWLKFDDRFFYSQNDFNRAFLTATFDVLTKSADVDETEKLLGEPLKNYFLEGSLSAVKKAVSAYDKDALIIEGNLSQKYNGAFKFDGSRFYGSNSHWAEYSIITSGLTDRAKAQRLKEAAISAAPARCVLVAVEARTTALRYDGKANYDKTYNYGVY